MAAGAHEVRLKSECPGHEKPEAPTIVRSKSRLELHAQTWQAQSLEKVRVLVGAAKGAMFSLLCLHPVQVEAVEGVANTMIPTMLCLN